MALALAAAIGACAGPNPGAGSSGGIDFVRPVLRGAENGLEMHWWVVQSDPAVLRESLRPYAEAPDGLSASEREALASQGLRVVRVPLAEVSALRESLRVRGRTERKWLGQAPWWIEALRGALTGETLVGSEGHVVTLPSGRLRVLARAPGAVHARGPVMRADLAIQHLPRTTELLPSLTERDARRGLKPQQQGRVFARSVASLKMHEGYAYLLVCDHPGTPWAEHADNELTQTYAAVPAAERAHMGPPTVTIPTVGERLLRKPAPVYSGQDPLTAVVVLAPRLPESFTLLP